MRYKTHLLFTKEELPDIRKKFTSGWYLEAYQELIRRADNLLNNDSPALDLIAPNHGYGTSARQLECKTTILGAAGHLSGNTAYLRRGVEIYLNTIRNFHIADFVKFNGHLCAGDAGRAHALAFDFLCEEMTEEEINFAIGEMTEVAKWLYEYPSAWSRPHKGVWSCNHNTVHYGGLGMIALILGGHEDWLERAVFQTRKYFEYATDSTGLLTEGLPYGSYGLLGAIPFCEAYRRATGTDLVDEYPKNRLIPNQLMAQTLPTKKKIVSYNDNSDTIPNLGPMMYLISKYKNGAALYWLQAITNKAEGDGSYGGQQEAHLGSGATLALTLLFSDPSIQAVPPEQAGIPLTRLFDSGRLFARESWSDPNSSLLFFTSGWDTHRGHNHCDQNSFAFFAHGEEFLIDPPMIPTPTESHNAVLVNGEGQGVASHGEIVAFEDRVDSVFVSGDATEAYDWSKMCVGYARRNLLYVKGKIPYLVIFDDIQTENDKENEYAFMMHTTTKNRIEIMDNTVLITGSNTGATCRLCWLNPESVMLGISDLEGKGAYRYNADNKYKDFYKEAYAKTTALSPKFVTLVTAAPAGSNHPEAVIRRAGTQFQIDICFDDAHTDRIVLDDYNIRKE